MVFKHYFLGIMDRVRFEEQVIQCLGEINAEEVLKKDDKELLKMYKDCIV